MALLLITPVQSAIITLADGVVLVSAAVAWIVLLLSRRMLRPPAHKSYVNRPYFGRGSVAGRGGHGGPSFLRIRKSLLAERNPFHSRHKE